MLCGSPSSTNRSLNVPGSLSSALQITYFLLPAALLTNFHFEAGREARAAAPLQTRSLELGDHVRGRHLGQRLAQRLIAVVRDVVFDALRIDQARALQHDALLGGQRALARD